MILYARNIAEKDGRRPYDLGGREIPAKHFVTRRTTPGNPFGPHTHDNPELWFILEGRAVVNLAGADHPVEKGDLVVIDPRVEHGLRTDAEVLWICLG